MLKAQTDGESTHIYEIMKEEKKVMYEKMQKIEKDLENKASAERRCHELEAQVNKLQQEIADSDLQNRDKDRKLQEQEEKLRSSKFSVDKL